MTGKQYKNIIKWTLANKSMRENSDSVKAVREILANCGVLAQQF